MSIKTMGIFQFMINASQYLHINRTEKYYFLEFEFVASKILAYEIKCV